MTLDLLIGGMPRGGTTVAAKFMSLHPDMFCYAGETHLIPFMHSLFGYLPCREDKIDLVTRFLRQQFMTAMVEMPRFSVSQGAHPGNLIFEEKNVDALVEAIRGHLTNRLYGEDLHRASLGTLRELLSKSKAEQRIILGEKTPNNIFAMADHAGVETAKNIVVMREPIGVLRSMKARVEGGDAYSGAFKGDLETNLGMYLEYALAARQILGAPGESLLVRYEDIALAPAAMVQEMFKLFGREPEDRVIQFVEGKWDRDIANRAPMNYRRLNITANYGELSPVDIWKVFSLTRELRKAFGYSDEAMSELGFELPSEWPDVEIPAKALPLYGFHQAAGEEAPWMKRRGGLVVYLGEGQSYDITLEFTSEIPDQVQGEVELRASVNGIQREVLTATAGSQSTVVNVKVHADELVPMGNKGGYAIIDLMSSVTYSRIGHTADGVDAREMSFQLHNWKIDKALLNGGGIKNCQFGFGEINMPTKELYLHIGRAKTGTTALQNCLHENRELLAQLGYCFPKTGTGPARSQAKIALACHHANLASEQALFALREEFEHEIAPFGRIIVSSEGFQNILNNNRLDLFFRRGYSPHTKLAFEYKTNVICYLRESLDYVRSAYAQRVQATGWCRSFSEFCSHFCRFDLNAFLNFWRTFADNVEFISYEIAAQKANGVVADFSERLGLNLLIGNSTVDSNPTISGNLLIFKLAMNKATPHKGEYYHALMRLARAESRFRGPFYISDEVADRLRGTFINYDEILRSTVGVYPKKSFSDALPLYDPANWRDDIEKFLAEPELAHLKELQEIRNIDPNTLAAHELTIRDNNYHGH